MPATKDARRARRASAAKEKRPAARKKAPAASPEPTSTIGVTGHRVGYTSHDLPAVKRFYTELLGFIQFTHDDANDHLAVRTGSSSSLGFSAPREGTGQSSPPTEPVLHFIVDDVDSAYAALSARGVMFHGPPVDMPWNHRVITTTDPEGRVIMIASATATP